MHVSKLRISQYFIILKLSIPCIFETNVLSSLHQPKAQYCAFSWCNVLSTIFLCPLQRRRHNNERVSNGNVSSISSTKHRICRVPTNPLLSYAQGAYPSLISTSVARAPSFITVHSPGLSIRRPLVYYHNHHRHLRRARNPPGSI
jgi:hypothetical protein